MSTRSEEAYQPRLDTKGELRVIDFFCGGGGFSEGFRQQGFKVVMGLDHWKPAVDSHNLNHSLDDKPRDILDFWSRHDTLNSDALKAIFELPDTEVIVGSPPCVSFSMANQAGEADKRLGVKLIESFLRVIAVKRNQPNSLLKAWYMENVPKSKESIKPTYSFRDLKLTSWAEQHNLNPDGPALSTNGLLLNSADYGSPQRRQRWLCGEVLSENGWTSYPSPIRTHGEDGLPAYKTLRWVLSKLPDPTDQGEGSLTDPNYSSLSISKIELSDHFYDTGIPEYQWQKAKQLKTDHPYFGKMSFPENLERPARTILATRSPSSREALILDCNRGRKGDGEYRLPTIREAASLMGFPITYQFVGSENSKWRQIGNAVCPHLSAALAKGLRVHLGLAAIEEHDLSFEELKHHEANESNLNDSSAKVFEAPRPRTKGSRFRMHPFKCGNMTVALTNYRPQIKASNQVPGAKWYAYAFFGTGEFDHYSINGNEQGKLRKLLINECGEDLVQRIQTQIVSKVSSYQILQSLHETNAVSNGVLTPSDLVAVVKSFAEVADPETRLIDTDQYGLGFSKTKIPLRQLVAMYAFDVITARAKALSNS